MSGGPTEYQVEYCGAGGSGGGFTKSSKDNPTIFPDVQKNYDLQPVGGRNQVNLQHSIAAAQPVVDADFVTSVYSDAERGTHRVAPQWSASQDPRWAEATRIASSTLYHPADRDPPSRPNFYVYRSTRIDAMDTPCTPLSVPDVHKLRYMHQDYMSHDDWY